MSRVIYFLVVGYLLINGFSGLSTMGGSYKEMSSLDLPVNGLNFGKAEPKAETLDILPKEEWPSIFVGTWSYKFNTVHFSEITDFTGKTTYHDDNTFTRLIEVRKYESGSSVYETERTREHLLYETGGLIKGRLDFNTEGDNFKEVILSCEGSKSKQQNICETFIKGRSITMGIIENKPLESKIYAFNKEKVVMTLYSYADQFTTTIYLEKEQ